MACLRHYITAVIYFAGINIAYGQTVDAVKKDSIQFALGRPAYVVAQPDNSAGDPAPVNKVLPHIIKDDTEDR